MGILATNYGFVLVGKETGGYGVDPTPDLALCLAERPTITPVRDTVEVACWSATAGGSAHSTIKDRITYSMKFNLGGIQNIDDGVPAVAALLEAAGLKETKTGTEAGGDVKAVYTPATIGHASVTMHAHIRDLATGEFVRIKLLGCRHNITITWSEKQPVMLQIDGECKYADWEPSQAIALPGAHGFGIQPFVATELDLQFSGRPYEASNISFATNWTLTGVPSITGSDGVAEVILTRELAGSRPGGSFNAIAKAAQFAATGELLHDAREANEAAFQLRQNDGSRRLTLSSAQAQIGMPAQAVDGSFVRHETPFFFNENAGDDDFELIFDTI